MNDESQPLSEYLPPPRTPFSPSNGWVSPGERLALLAGILFLCGLIGLTGFVTYRFGTIDDSIEQSRISTAQSRAVGCQVLLALGQPLPPKGSCFAPEVLKYYDPEAVVPPTRTSGLICDIGRQVGIEEKDLPVICTVAGDGND